MNKEDEAKAAIEKKERFARLKKIKRKIVHVLNPVSGSSKYYEDQKLTVEEIGGDVLLSERHGHITELVDDYLKNNPSAHIVVYGGDGSLYEAVNGIMKSGASETAVFSIIPSGSGNDFSSYANNSDEFPKGESRRIDLIKTTCGNDVRYFGNMMNIGFDCSVVYETNKIREKGILKGPASYIAGVVKQLFKKEPIDAKVTLSGCIDIKTGEPVDDITISQKILLTACANGRFCGGGFKAAPIASLNDGIMDILVINNVSVLTFAKLVSYYHAGTFIDKDGVLLPQFVPYLKYIKCRKMSITGPKMICLDGELFDIPENGTLDVEVIPDAINYVAI